MGAFLRSKKGWGTILAAIVLISGGFLHPQDAYYWAVAAVFGGHQIAQGVQDHAVAIAGKATAGG